MKFLKSAVLAALLSTVFFACKKDNNEPGFIIEGKWEGKLGNGNATPTGFIGLTIKPGGVLERTISSGSVSATGTWQLNGNSFTGTYTFTSSGTVVNLVGTVDKAKNKISGTWSNPSEDGQWYVNK